MKEMAEKKGTHSQSMIKSVIIGLITGTVCISLLFTVIALIIGNSNIPVPSISTIVLVCAGISSFSGGFVAAKKYRRKGLIVGLLLGLLFVGILVTVALIGSGTVDFAENTLKYIVVLVSAMLGGMLGVNHRKKRRR